MYTQVTRENRLAWENFTNYHTEAQWYEEGRQYQKNIGLDDLDNRPPVKTGDPDLILTTGIANYVYDYERDIVSKGSISPDADFFLPIWQVSVGFDL